MSEEFGIEYTPSFYMIHGSGEEAPPGMDCLQLHSTRSQPQPFHYLINEQAKSLLALQELQNEVGALLEFRDLVMETFPNLRQKMSNNNSNIQSSSSNSLNSRHHWEPGIKVKRKIINKENDSFRSRSNSHSSTKQPKSTEAISSGVQDSGFSTETNSSSSKDNASSVQTEKKDEKQESNETEDELWNLLDVIQTKGIKLKEEVETLQLMLMVDDVQDQYENKLERRCQSLDSFLSNKNYELFDKDKELLVEKLIQTESDNNKYKLKTCQLQDEIDTLIKTKTELEDQLKQAMSNTSVLNSRIQELHVKYVTNKASRTSPAAASRTKLGSLDNVLNHPRRIKNFIKSIKPDRRKLTSILNEKNYLELQRHLLVYVFENQSLSSQLETTIKVKEGLFEQLDKYKEENDELKFLLEERNIELEGTKAQVRVLEKFHQQKQEQASGTAAGVSGTTVTNGEDKKYCFLDDNHLKLKGFSENEINRARQIFMDTSFKKKPEDGPRQSNDVLPILALPMPQLSSHQSSGTESTHALEISSELELEMSKKSDMSMSLRCHDRSPYKRRPSKIPLMQRTTSPNSKKDSKVSLKKNDSLTNSKSPTRVKKKDEKSLSLKSNNNNISKQSLTRRNERQNRDSFRRNDSLTSIRKDSIKYKTNGQLSKCDDTKFLDLFTFRQ